MSAPSITLSVGIRIFASFEIAGNRSTIPASYMMYNVNDLIHILLQVQKFYLDS